MVMVIKNYYCVYLKKFTQSKKQRPNSTPRKHEIVEALEIYKDFPIIITSESMADILGWTETAGRIQYLGDPKYENDVLFCKGEKLFFEGLGLRKSGGNLKFMSNVEAFLSLLIFEINQWGYKGLCRAICRMEPEVKWADAVIKHNLEDTLIEKLKTAISLGEDDETIIEAANIRLDEARIRLNP